MPEYGRTASIPAKQYTGSTEMRIFMKIALINENSQAAKNEMICATLKSVVEPMGHEVFNYGMYSAEDTHQLTYVQNGILAAAIPVIINTNKMKNSNFFLILFLVFILLKQLHLRHQPASFLCIF